MYNVHCTYNTIILWFCETPICLYKRFYKNFQNCSKFDFNFIEIQSSKHR